MMGVKTFKNAFSCLPSKDVDDLIGCQLYKGTRINVEPVITYKHVKWMVSQLQTISPDNISNRGAPVCFEEDHRMFLNKLFNC